MTELIEKISYEARLKELVDLQYIKVEELQEYIAKEVELAYKAGMLKFNALDHTFQAPGTKLLFQWNKEDLSFMEVGEEVLLPSLYLQAKGFKR
jgi:hypothetical protein